MDEPKQSTARASGYILPIALGILLIGYVWPEHDQQGVVNITYSRLLGFRVDGQWQWRSVAGTVVAHLPLFVVALAAAPRVTARRRALVLGAAALLGIAEVLQSIATGVFGEFIGVGMFLTGGGGVLLLVAALGTLDREPAPEIRETQEARA